MKKLIFIRHGKAEEPSSEISDFERSLTLRGKVIAGSMAMLLKEKENNPLIFITSPAFRALETAIIFAEKAGINPEEIKLDSKIYYNLNFQYIKSLTKRISEESDIIVLFGHNPSFTELSGSLAKHGCDFLPKCGIAAISFNISSWTELSLKSGKLEYFLKPDKQ